MPIVVQGEGVGVRFPGGRWVLRQLDFQITTGEFIAIVGPSGCGKTTLLRLLAGLIEPTEGELRVENSLARHSYVFQESTLLPWRTAVDNVILPLELQGKRDKQTRENAFSSLEATGITREDAAKYPRQLSGGMQMRVSLARALVNDPQLLLLDEPFAAVDDLLRQRLNDELLTLWENSNWTAVLVTHNLAEAVYLSDRVWLLTGDPLSPIEEFQNEQPRQGQESDRKRAGWKKSEDFHRQVEHLTTRLHATSEGPTP